MDVFIKAPKTTAERIAGTALGPFLPSLLLVFPPSLSLTSSVILLHSPPFCPAAEEENP